MDGSRPRDLAFGCEFVRFNLPTAGSGSEVFVPCVRLVLAPPTSDDRRLCSDDFWLEKLDCVPDNAESGGGGTPSVELGLSTQLPSIGL